MNDAGWQILAAALIGLAGGVGGLALMANKSAELATAVLVQNEVIK